MPRHCKLALQSEVAGCFGDTPGLWLPLSITPPCVSQPLTDSDVDRQHGLGHGQRPDMQAVQGFHPLHRQQQIPHSREVHALGGPWGWQGQGLKETAPSHPCWFLPQICQLLREDPLGQQIALVPTCQRAPSYHRVVFSSSQRCLKLSYLFVSCLSPPPKWKPHDSRRVLYYHVLSACSLADAQ